MSESGAVGKLIRRSRTEADRLVAEYEQSGMTRTAFCRAHGVSAHTLDYYRRMRRGQGDGKQRLVAVELVEGVQQAADRSASLRVELKNGRRIMVEEGFSAALLRSVVAALEV